MDQKVLNWIAAERKGSLHAGEREVLAAWRAADPDHESAYRTMVALWDVTPGADPVLELPAADADAAWSRFEAALPPAPEQAAVRPLFSVGLMVRVAAAVTLLLAAVWYLNRPDTATPLQYQAESGERAITLPDGSEVVLRRNAVLTALPVRSGVTSRGYRLTGEAFFQVLRDERHPFTVLTEAVEVTVLGTSFYIAAPGDGADHTVAVTEGRVAVKTLDGKRERNLAAGEAVSCSADRAAWSPMVLPPNSQAWHTGILVFQGAPLSEVIAALEEHFGVQVRLSDTAMANCRYSGRIARDDLQDALRALAATMEMTLKRSPEGVHYLTGGKCH